MANPVYVTYASGATGVQTAIALDNYQTPFNASFQVFPVSTATYGVQYTLDDVQNANARWTDDATAPTGTTTAKTGSYAYPIRGLRLNIAANATGIEFKIVQGFATF